MSNRSLIEPGFTLVEVLIVAPIVILMIGVFISSIVSMTGDVLSTRSGATLSYNIQDALGRIERDVNLSGGFLSTNNVALMSPQGYNNDSTNFDNANSSSSIGPMLILNAYATTSNPSNSSDNIMRMANQPYACNSTQLDQNPAVTINIVYFVKNNILWRRVIMPSNYEKVGCVSGSIGVPWQQPSCYPGISGTMCDAEDVKLVEGIADGGFSISYFTNSGSTTENTIAGDSSQSDSVRQSALQSTAAVSVTINANVTAAGRTVSQSGTIRATSKNNNISPTADTTWSPLLAQTSSWTDYDTNHNSHGYRRTKDGVVILKGLIKKSSAVVGGEVIATLPDGYRPSEQLVFQTATNSNTASRVDVKANGDITVVSGNAGWLSLNGVKFLAADRAGDFTEIPPLNTWLNFGSPYSNISYALDASGRVHTKALIKNNSSTSPGVPVIASLPSGARPPEYTHFAVNNSGGFGFISISSTNGDITPKVTAATTPYLSLQTMFYPAGHSDWNDMTYQGTWVPYSTSYKPAYTKSADGLVTLKGLVKSGALSSVITNLPPGYRPAKQTLLNTASNGVFARIDVLSNGDIMFYAGDPGWVSFDGIVFYADQ